MAADNSLAGERRWRSRSCTSDPHFLATEFKVLLI